MANECRKVWHEAGLVSPARRTVSLTARWMTDSCRWCLCRSPVWASTWCDDAGKTHCQALAIGAGVLSDERVRQRGAAQISDQVLLVLAAHSSEVRLQWRPHGCRQHGHPVLATLSVAHGDLIALEVHVFDPQAQAFQQPHAGAVQQCAHQARGPVEFVQDRIDFLAGQHDRQPALPTGPNDTSDLAQRAIQDFVVEEQEGGQGLVLSRGGHTIADGQVGQERVNLPLAHLARSSFIMERNEPPDPGRVRLLGSPAVVTGAEGLAHAIQEPERLRPIVRNAVIGRRGLIVAAICRPKRGGLNSTACKQRQQACEDSVGVGHCPVLPLRLPAPQPPYRRRWRTPGEIALSSRSIRFRGCQDPMALMNWVCDAAST